MTFNIFGEAWSLIIEVVVLYLLFMLGNYLIFYAKPGGKCYRRSTDIGKGGRHV
tara:strand:+ start:61 stop:222 length:162 start_codon:yes stop_codon:yes gene_type:complete